MEISRLNQLTANNAKAMHLSNNNKTAAQEHLATDYTVIRLTKTFLTGNN